MSACRMQRDELIGATEAYQTKLGSIFEKMPLQVYAAKPIKGWSPAQNLNHILKVNRLISMLFGPLRFGSALAAFRHIPERSIEGLKEQYLESLRRGFTAGAFSPSRLQKVSEEDRREALARLAETTALFCERISRWSEEDLDRVKFPHPAVGPVTAREMAHFTLFHAQHHMGVVASRHPDQVPLAELARLI